MRIEQVAAVPAGGEPLLLALDAVKNERDRRTGKQRFWLNVSENPYEQTDSRADGPAFKNRHATRQIPISRPLVDAIDAFVENHRGPAQALV